MIFEHLNYMDGKVEFLADGKGKDLEGFKDIKSFNLSETHDSFYNQNLDSNYGQVARNTTEMLDKVKKATPNFVSDSSKKSPNLDPNEEEQLAELNKLKEAVEKLPELKRQKMIAYKHLDIVDSLTQIIKSKKLMDQRKLEDAILSSKNDQEISDLFRDAIFDFDEKSVVRLCLVFIMKFKSLGRCHGNQPAIRKADLESIGVEEVTFPFF